MGLMFIIGQFLLNPVVLLGTLRVCAREENEMTYLGTFFTSTIAMVVAIGMKLGLSTEIGSSEAMMAACGAFFGITLLFVVWLSRISFAKGFLAAIIFCAYKAAMDFVVVAGFVEPAQSA